MLRIETDRLVLRKPNFIDADAIFTRYASDPAVTRYLSWATHRNVEDTRHFLGFSEAEWRRWPAGPYLVESRADGLLLGSSGLSFKTPQFAVTGYVFARDAWGRGYATETLNAIISVARDLGVRRLDAMCHEEHVASRHVLEKCGFKLIDAVLSRFPNLDSPEPQNTVRYSLSVICE